MQEVKAEVLIFSGNRVSLEWFIERLEVMNMLL